MTSVSRRNFLILLALAPAAVQRVASGQNEAATKVISVDEFLRLSEHLTGREKLGRELATTYRDALVASPANIPLLAQLVAGESPTPAHVALEGMIVEWWYTGVYTIDGQPRVATHNDALIWSTLRVPAPGMCAGAFGAWANPPPAQS
jgi:hypothetical protein